MRAHVRRRARDRYGVRLVRDDLEAIVDQIVDNDGRAWFVKKQSNRVSHWLVLYRGEMLAVVYDKNRRELATVLPATVAKQYAQQVGIA